MQKRAATPTSKGAVTVDGQVLQPQDLMLYYEFNPRDYEQHFYAEQLQPKLLGRELPVTAEAFLLNVANNVLVVSNTASSASLAIKDYVASSFTGSAHKGPSPMPVPCLRFHLEQAMSSGLL
jgi:hypothetical protein